MIRNFLLSTLYISILSLFLFPKVAFAYIDPGTGSYLFQFLIAGLLGGVFFLKNFWLKIKNILMKKSKDDQLEKVDD